MPLNSSQDSSRRFPAGFTQHSGGLASEYAREQGWGINEDERTQTPRAKEDADGGRDYDYGPRDFGDTAVDTSTAQPAPARQTSAQGRQVSGSSTRDKAVHHVALRKSR